LLVVYSDGILEAANARDQEFGEERVIAAIERNASKPPDTICAAILADVRAFLGKELPQDDQTLLVARLDRLALASGPAKRAALAGAPLDNSSRNLEK
jgi:serine phosphatase RsbU (regulator of sigma subunit)